VVPLVNLAQEMSQLDEQSEAVRDHLPCLATGMQQLAEEGGTSQGTVRRDLVPAARERRLFDRVGQGYQVLAKKMLKSEGCGMGEGESRNIVGWLRSYPRTRPCVEADGA